MIFYTTKIPLSKAEVSEHPYKTNWVSYEPASHQDLANKLTKKNVVGCSLGNVKNKDSFRDNKVYTSSTAIDKTYFTRTGRTITENSNALLLDIELSSTLEDWIEPKLNSLTKVETFVRDTLKLKSYIIGKSSSAISNNHTNKWHVYALFDKKLNLTKTKNFVFYNIPTTEWYYGLKKDGKTVIKNSYVDESTFVVSRFIYEHPNVEFKVVDNGLNSASSLIDKYTKQFTPNPFLITQPFPKEEQDKRITEYTRKYSPTQQKTMAAGYFTLDTKLQDKQGNDITVRSIVEANKDTRVASLLDNDGQAMAYYSKSQLFIDWHDNNKRYKVAYDTSKVIEFDSQYLPELNLDNHNTFILAPTGSGKTTTIKQQLKGSKSIMIVPTTSIVVDQDGHISGLSHWADLSPTELNVMTYNKFYGHLKTGVDISEYNIIIDEVHTIFNFENGEERHFIFNSILQRKVLFKKLILLSATMDSHLLPVKDLYSYIYISTRKLTRIEFVQNYTDVSQFIKGRTLIFQQNKNKNAYITDELRSKGKNVLNLQSGDSIPDSFLEYDVIITTSVLKEGFSITDHIDTVLLQNSYQPTGAYGIIQSIARPRTSTPDIKILSPETHFKKEVSNVPTLAELTKLAELIIDGYVPKEVEIIKTINIDEFKTHVLQLDIIDGIDTVVINQVGLITYYLKVLERCELSNKALMTENLKSFLHCEVLFTNLYEARGSSTSEVIKQLEKRLHKCTTFDELNKLYTEIEDLSNYLEQAKHLLNKRQEQVHKIETKDGPFYLTEAQQVQYITNPAVYALINQHRKNISNGVYDLLEESRAWKKKEEFAVRELKIIFKKLDKKQKITTENLFKYLKKVCRFEKVNAKGKVVKRGAFDFIRITNKRLFTLSDTFELKL